MMTTRRRVLGFGLMMPFLRAADVLGQEKTFPTKPISLYVGYAPGGGAAVTGAVLAEGMKKYLRQPVVVEFKPGASQTIAVEFVKNSRPDGYTLFYVSHGELIAKIARDQKEGTTTKVGLDDLDSLGAVPFSPFAVAVKADSPWRTVDELIGAARKSPGTLAYGSAGLGTTTHLLAELFASRTGTALNHIPFSGGGPAITALLGGHVQMTIMSVATFGAHIKPGGGLRALVVFDQKRDRSQPDVPTAVERGYDIAVSAWWGVQAPKGLSPAVRASLVDAIDRAARDPDVLAGLGKLDCNIAYLNPDEVRRKIQVEHKLFLDTWGTIGVKK